ncbi:uncharacterized protein LOC118511758 [Anopheles stephensi]|uniref:uncharacterized protein LOC118511758 n=1 Tax=Anopheles stephensi TaxID=30069 RepID=UPI001658B3D0|nr:uncharacterized protein LOC118511758 [Anopheles stephensi]
MHFLGDFEVLVVPVLQFANPPLICPLKSGRIAQKKCHSIAVVRPNIMENVQQRFLVTGNASGHKVTCSFEQERHVGDMHSGLLGEYWSRCKMVCIRHLSERFQNE